MATKGKPQYNYINTESLKDNILECFNKHLYILGFDDQGIDNSNERKPRYITHNQINYILRQIYNDILKPNKPLFNNQKSILNYDDIEQLNIIANIFIDICTKFNKSLGLMSFSFLSGIDYTTLIEWLNDKTVNPKRSAILKTVQESHKAIHISLLNESGLGQVAVANNDIETGLQWQQQARSGISANAVYILPSERVDKLKLTKDDQEKVVNKV